MTPRLFADSAVANSLRPSAGGANEEAAPRTRDVTPRTDSIASWAVEPVSRSLDPTSLASGFNAHESSGSHAPSTNSPFRLDNGRTYYRRSVTEGPALALRLLPALSTLLRRTMTTCPVPGDWPSPSLDSVPRSALRPALDHGAKMPRTRFYNRRFAPRAPMANITFGDCPSSHCGKPASVRFRDRLLEHGRSWRSRFLGRRRTTLRSSGPPTAARLTTRCRLRADRLPRSRALWAPGGSEAPLLCRLAGAPPNRTL